MKKLLALVLALVMTLGLATVGANAAFADADAIEHTEAVEVLNSLGVIGGKENNNFDPSGNVKRSEMAKMVALIMLGDVDDTAFKGAPTDLTDIDGHWAEGWIKYCVSQGIVGGRGNGKFDPDDNVTASEAAKMLLVAIGYNASVQGYTGGQWQVNVARDAQISGFYKQLSSLGANKALTRDEAAQMIYNAADCDQTSHTEQLSSSGERITVYTAKDAALGSLLESAYKVVTLGENGLTYLQNSKLVDAGQYKGLYRLTMSAGGPYYAKADYSDLLGQAVVIRYANNDGAAGYTPPKDELIGIYAYSQSTAVGPFAWGQLERDADAKIKAAGTVYSLDADNGVTVYAYDEEGTGDYATYTIAAATANKAAELITNVATAANNYSTVKLIDNDGDNKYERAVVTKIIPAKITYTDSSKVIAGAETYKNADYIIDENLAKDDYAAISFNFAEGKTQLVEIEKQTGKVTATKAGPKVQIDGGSTWYGDASATAMVVDSTYDYWMLNGGIYASKITAAAGNIENFVFVSNFDEGMSGTTAKIWHVDGSSEIVKIDTSSNGAWNPNSANFAHGTGGENRFYTISQNGSAYRFTDADTKLAEGAILAGYTFADDVNVVASANKVSTIGGAQIEDDAVIFVINTKYDNGAATVALGAGNQGYDVKVINGKQAKQLAAYGAGDVTTVDFVDTAAGQAPGVMTHSVNGVTKVHYAAVNWVLTADAAQFTGWTTAGLANDNYALVTSNAVTVSGGTQYTIWTGSENVTVLDKSSTAAAKFNLVAYDEITSDGEIKGVTLRAHTQNAGYAAAANAYYPAALTGFEKVTGGYDLYLNGAAAKTITTDEDTVWIYANTGASNANDIGVATATDLLVADKISKVSAQNIMVYTQANGGPATVVVVDVTNRLATGAASNVAFAAVANLGGFTVTLNGDAVVDATTSVSGYTKLKAGDILTIKKAGTIADFAGDGTSAGLVNSSTEADIYNTAYGTAGTTWTVVVSLGQNVGTGVVPAAFVAPNLAD